MGITKKCVPTAWGIYWELYYNGQFVSSCEDSELYAELAYLYSIFA